MYIDMEKEIEVFAQEHELSLDTATKALIALGLTVVSGQANVLLIKGVIQAIQQALKAEGKINEISKKTK